MRRQYCLSAALFQRFSHHLGNQAVVILVIALLMPLTRPVLKEAYTDGGQPAVFVRTVLAAVRAAKNDLVTAKPLISSNPFNADRIAINNQIKKLQGAEDNLCQSYPEECHPDAEDLAKPPQLTVGITDPNVTSANDAAKAGQAVLKKYQNLSGVSSDQRAAIDQNLAQLEDVTTCKITITQPSGAVTAFTNDSSKNPILNITANIPLASDAPVKILLDGAEVGSLSPKGTIWGSDQFHLDGTGKTGTSVITVTGTAGNPPVTCTSTNAITVNWKAPPKPVIKFSANPDEVKPLDPLKKWSALSWEITDADTATIDQGVGAVNAKAGSKLVTPQQETTYILTAKGPGGEVNSDPVTVKVIKKPVITSFGANPPQIAPGQSSALFWSIDDADRASIDQGIGAVNPTSGSGLTVSPQQTTTYTLTASGPGGDALPKTATVSVKPVITSFTANPDEIAPGQSSTLSWTITGATSASIDQGVGAADPKSGSTTVSPQQKTTYTLTASGPGGNADPKSVTVRVESKPQTYTITLESSGGGNLATTDQVTVDGTVSPAPPAGTVVALGVNGTSAGTVNVDSSGFFVAVVPLQNKTTLADLVLFNDDVFVTTCGGAVAPVDLWNSTTQAKTQNSIEAAVAAPGGGQASNVASVVIFHGVRVIDAEVVWGGQCPGPYADFSGGEVLGPGDVVTVAEAQCGVPCDKVGSGVFCTATATANVTTTAGELSQSALWSVDISP